MKDEKIHKIILGDCIIKLKELEENSIDSIVTDPPAGISFMGKSWDSDKGGRDNWIKWMSEVATECKRVLKPGGHAFVWAIPRTSHWTATAWENAGFEIRDVVAHVFGSGFPKSLNIGKQVDKLQGNEREVVGTQMLGGNAAQTTKEKGGTYASNTNAVGVKPIEVKLTKGTSEYEGWGTALKPAREDWILMRKPLEKGLNIAENCLKYGTGGINIDESRVGTEDTRQKTGGAIEGSGWGTKGGAIAGSELGRFPANLIHDNSEEVRECFPETGKGGFPKLTKDFTGESNITFRGAEEREERINLDSGNASRFFKSIIYQAKASKSERNKGCEGLEEKEGAKQFNEGMEGQLRSDGTVIKESIKHHNNHPTVKPIALMEYLIKMVTKPGGVVLDPFAGSGSTLVAAKQNGFQYVGIEMTEEYIPIIEARLSAVQQKLL